MSLGVLYTVRYKQARIAFVRHRFVFSNRSYEMNKNHRKGSTAGLYSYVRRESKAIFECLLSYQNVC